MVSAFATATGVEIDYTGSQDLASIVQAGLDSGNPPDIVNTLSTATVRAYAEDGLLLPLGDVVSAEDLTHFDKALQDSISVDGEPFAIWNTLDVFDLWYNTATYEGPTSGTWSDLIDWAATATDDNAAFCMGLEAGPGTGWPAQIFIESVFLSMWGPEKLTEWANGDLPWTSPEVRAAFVEFGKIASSTSLVEGGATGILNRPFGDYVTGMFSDPQTCQLALLGGYVVPLAQSMDPDVTAPDDIDFFPVPPADSTGVAAQNVAGATMFAFAQNDSPELRAALSYLASSEAQSLLAASGIWQVANTAVPVDAYPTEVGAVLAEQLATADELVVGPATAATQQVNMAWISGIVGYLQEPDTLDEQLAAIDAVASE